MSREKCSDLFFKLFHFKHVPTRQEVFEAAQTIARADDEELEEIKMQAMMFLEGECVPFIPEILETLRYRLQSISRLPDEVLANIFSKVEDVEDKKAVTATSKLYRDLQINQELKYLEEHEENENYIPLDDVNSSVLIGLLEPDRIDRVMALENEVIFNVFLRLSVMSENFWALEKLLSREQEPEIIFHLLLFTIRHGRCKPLAFLLDKFPDMINFKNDFSVDGSDRYGNIYIYAAYYAQLECAKEIKSRGGTDKEFEESVIDDIFDINKGSQVTEKQIQFLYFILDNEEFEKWDYANALQYVSGTCFVDAAKHLLQKYHLDPNEPNDENQTYVMEAVATGCVEMVQLFLELGGDPNSIYHDENISLIGKAVERGELGIIQLLLKYGADPNLPKHNRNLPLRLAERIHRQDIIDVLLAHGARNKIFHGEVDYLRRMVELLKKWKQVASTDGLHRGLSKLKHIEYQIKDLEEEMKK